MAKEQIRDVIFCLMKGSCLMPERHAQQLPQTARARCLERQMRSSSGCLCFASSFNQLSNGLSAANSPSPFYSYKIYRSIHVYVMQSALKQAQTLGSSESRGKPPDVAREATRLKAKSNSFYVTVSIITFLLRHSRLARLTGILKSELHR